MSWFLRRPRLRYAFLHQIPPIIFGVALLETAIFAKNWFLPVLLIGLLIAGLFYAWVHWADHWRGYRPVPEQTFRPDRCELPLVADHRDLLGQGEVRNHLHHDGWDAFEIVQGRKRTWWFAVPVSTPQARGHLRPFRTNGSPIPGDRGFLSRYDVEGTVPRSIRPLLERAAHEPDVTLDGDHLFATAPMMTARYFPWWLANIGMTVLAMADVLDRHEELASAEKPALPASDPARNIWTGATQNDALQPEAVAWEQPHDSSRRGATP